MVTVGVRWLEAVALRWTFCWGAALWMVVRVVVKDLTECAGDEKVLFLSPSVFAAVALVPAFEFAASDAEVSAVVESVGALDFCA